MDPPAVKFPATSHIDGVNGYPQACNCRDGVRVIDGLVRGKSWAWRAEGCRLAVSQGPEGGCTARCGIREPR